MPTAAATIMRVRSSSHEGGEALLEGPPAEKAWRAITEAPANGPDTAPAVPAPRWFALRKAPADEGAGDEDAAPTPERGGPGARAPPARVCGNV